MEVQSPKNRYLSSKSWKLLLALLGALAFTGPRTSAADDHVAASAGTHLIKGAVANEEELLHQQNYGTHPDVHAQGLPPVKDEPLLSQWGPPKDFTSYGHRIDWLFQYTSWVAFAFFCVMAGSLIYFVVRYRERPGHKALYTKGIDRASTGFTRFLDVLVFVTLDAVLLVSSFRDTTEFMWKYPAGDNVVKVMVMPQQWAWNFRYAGDDGAFNTADDIVTVNEMAVPRDKPILIQIMSKDVIHGFFIPNARMQIDAIPGQVSKFWFDANQTGHFEIACFHLCGTAHYKMKAFLNVMEESDYQLWAQEQSRWAKAKFDPEDKAVQWGWDWGI